MKHFKKKTKKPGSTPNFVEDIKTKDYTNTPIDRCLDLQSKLHKNLTSEVEITNPSNEILMGIAFSIKMGVEPKTLILCT